jgi:hypothetical protein
MYDQRTVGLTMAKEHLQMRQMIESLLFGGITPAAFAKKYKDFKCDPSVEVYVGDIIENEGFRRHSEKEAIHGKVN